VIFTLPDSLSRITLGNRREIYRLLFQSAWSALRDQLREEQGVEPAALMVLHTWNQQLEHHPHIHALVPGGGPSLDGRKWIRTRHAMKRRRKSHLVDNHALGRRFRDRFVAGLNRLHRRGKLKLGPLSLVRDYDDFVTWTDSVADQDWVVYIQPPLRDHSDPEHVLKYLARYLTGGPISDRRLISHENDQVKFWARSKDKKSGNPSRPFPLSGREFVRRWAIHILPKGFTKSRHYGGFSGRLRTGYLSRCRELLKLPDVEPAQRRDAADETPPPTPPTCPHCEAALECTLSQRRPSWRDIFREPSKCPVCYGFSIPGKPHHRPRPREPVD
jgi:hypothetical protein